MIPVQGKLSLLLSIGSAPSVSNDIGDVANASTILVNRSGTVALRNNTPIIANTGTNIPAHTYIVNDDIIPELTKSITSITGSEGIVVITFSTFSGVILTGVPVNSRVIITGLTGAAAILNGIWDVTVGTLISVTINNGFEGTVNNVGTIQFIPNVAKTLGFFKLSAAATAQESIPVIPANTITAPVGTTHISAGAVTKSNSHTHIYLNAVNNSINKLVIPSDGTPVAIKNLLFIYSGFTGDDAGTINFWKYEP